MVTLLTHICVARPQWDNNNISWTLFLECAADLLKVMLEIGILSTRVLTAKHFIKKATLVLCLSLQNIFVHFYRYIITILVLKTALSVSINYHKTRFQINYAVHQRILSQLEDPSNEAVPLASSDSTHTIACREENIGSKRNPCSGMETQLWSTSWLDLLSASQVRMRHAEL